MAYKGAKILVLVHQRLRVFFSFTGGTTREGDNSYPLFIPVKVKIW